MHIAITSRIFEPEPSAASFRLAALAQAFTDAGHEVTVLTVKPPTGMRADDANREYQVRRFSVLRDKTGYVRGYLQYLSFDIPLFFRVLFGKKQDLIVTEPPPTTGFFVRLAATLRRTPYAYYAADIWSDASESTGAPKFVVNAVRRMERFSMRGAIAVLAVNDGVSERARTIAPGALIHTIGNGIDTVLFSANGPSQTGGPYFLYAGTASEWQGAGILIEAFAQLLPEHPEARLVFLGQGSDWPALQQQSAELPDGAVQFVPTVPAAEAAAWLRGATASVASIRPDSGYSFAFPTKVFASWATGTPVIFAGDGAVRDFFVEHATVARARDGVRLGHGCDYEVSAVSAAMRDALVSSSTSVERAATGAWAANNVSLSAVALRAVSAVIGQYPVIASNGEETQ